MFITESEVAIILVSQAQAIKPTPAECPGILVGVHGKISIDNDRGLEGVG